MSKQPWNRDHIRYAVEEIERMGGKAELILAKRSSHTKCVISFNGKTKPIFLSGSPQDNKVKYIIRSDIKKAFAELSR